MRSSLTPRWTARTPGMPRRFDRLRFHSADAGTETAAAVTPAPAAPAPAAPAPAAPAPATPAAVAPAAVAPAAVAPAAVADWDGNVESLPAGAQALIRSLRGENASTRVRARTDAETAAADAQRETLRQLAEAMGLQVSDAETAPDPAQLAEQVRAAQATARQAQLELAVLRAAGPAGADATALLDSRAFLAAVDKLDPAAADFAKEVNAAITKAVGDNPKLKVAPVAASSVDLAGGTGGQPRTPSSLSDAIGGHYGTGARAV